MISSAEGMNKFITAKHKQTRNKTFASGHAQTYATTKSSEKDYQECSESLLINHSRQKFWDFNCISK